MVKKSDIFPDELIGEEIIIVQAKNASLLGLRGRIVDETKSTLVVETAHGQKTVLKQGVTISLQRDGRRISGKSIARRPEERIKG